MSPPPYSSETYDIRPAKSNEETDLIWSKFMLELGWDRYGDDLATYMDFSHGKGMLLAFPKGSRQPVGHVAAVINDNSTGWASLFIVEEEYRGVGLGAALFKAMLKDLSPLEFAGLDAVPAQIRTYERRGFVESKLGILDLRSRPYSTSAPAALSSVRTINIRKVSPQLLAEYENKYTGILRLGLWKNLLARPDMIGFVQADGEVGAIEDIHAVTVIRRCPGGSRLGPLLADSPETAEAVLVEAILASTPAYVKKFPFKKQVKLDRLDEQEISNEAVLNAEIWSGNPASVPLFEKYGFKRLGTCHRMWLDGKATPQQSAGGSAEHGAFAMFDGAVG